MPYDTVLTMHQIPSAGLWSWNSDFKFRSDLTGHLVLSLSNGSWTCSVIISSRQFTNGGFLGCTLRDPDFTGLSWTSDISIKNKYIYTFMNATRRFCGISIFGNHWYPKPSPQGTNSLHNLSDQRASSLCLNIPRKKTSGSAPVSGGCLDPNTERVSEAASIFSGRERQVD